MGRRSLSASAAILTLALLLPAAVRGNDDREATATAFRLQASNGFSLLAVAVMPPEGEEGSIGLYLTHGRNAGVTYAAPAKVTPTTIDADLGELGRISLTRAPTGRTRAVHLKCGSQSTERVPAERYEGVIEFHGEEGFTDLEATSAPLVYPPPCGIPEGGGGTPSKSLPGAFLRVEKYRIDRYGFRFDALQTRPGTKTLISAEVEEHRGGMEIHRGVAIRARSSALHYDRLLQHATARPPAPFSGHASYHSSHAEFRGHDPGSRWTGNLAVDFPGHRDVPMTGPGFRASLEHPSR
jgi:hypothetical protein